MRVVCVVAPPRPTPPLVEDIGVRPTPNVVMKNVTMTFNAVFITFINVIITTL